MPHVAAGGNAAELFEVGGGDDALQNPLGCGDLVVPHREQHPVVG